MTSDTVLCFKREKYDHLVFYSFDIEVDRLIWVRDDSVRRTLSNELGLGPVSLVHRGLQRFFYFIARMAKRSQIC